MKKDRTILNISPAKLHLRVILFLGSLRKKGLEVLYTVEQSKKFDGWKLKSVTKDSLNIDDKDERSQRRNLSH